MKDRPERQQGRGVTRQLSLHSHAIMGGALSRFRAGWPARPSGGVSGRTKGDDWVRRLKWGVTGRLQNVCKEWQTLGLARPCLLLLYARLSVMHADKTHDCSLHVWVSELHASIYAAEYGTKHSV